MKVTTKQHILMYLGPLGWCSGTQLEDQAGVWFTKSSVISRRARELCADGYLERSIGKHGAVQYRIPVPERVPTDEIRSVSWL